MIGAMERAIQRWLEHRRRLFRDPFYAWWMNPITCRDGEWKIVHLRPEDFDAITVGTIDASSIQVASLVEEGDPS